MSAIANIDAAEVAVIDTFKFSVFLKPLLSPLLFFLFIYFWTLVHQTYSFTFAVSRMQFYLFLSIFLSLSTLNLGVTEEEKADCVDIALINFNRECRIGKFRAPCYNGTRAHRNDSKF